MVVLELQNICFTIDNDGEDHDLIHQASIEVSPGHFMAIVGPSGCGKTTLLKIIAGLSEESAGAICWDGRNLSEEGDLAPTEIGYVPQFSIAYDHLTVEESIDSAVHLRVRTGKSADAHDIADRVLAQTGLEELRDRPVRVLSGGQKRRLGLAIELVSDPRLLLCDEVTSGLDPKSEAEIVSLMHDLSRGTSRIVVNVTHSLSNLELYDSVLVMFEGRVAYHGPPGALAHYFSVDNAEDIYPRLAKRSADRWHTSWSKNRGTYYKALTKLKDAETREAPPAEHVTAQLPGAISQFLTLLGRRFRLFARDRTHLLLHLAILVGFPLLVIIFALDGIEPMPQRIDFSAIETAADYADQTGIIAKQVELGGLVSGLVMFQIILLTLMGSNNAAREIAGERLIFEKEKFGGVRPSAYLLSKVAFLGFLVLAQSTWMAVFVNQFAHLPGDFTGQLLLLVAANAAMTFVCLGISSLMKSPEQSSLLSVYLVGFQLPLSGAVLALPGTLETFTRPFIAAYWAWSGQLQSMKSTDYFVGIKEATSTSLDATPSIALFVLGCHVVVGLVAAYVGTRHNRWD